MEFQVYSVNLEDRYPPGLPEGTTRDDLASPTFADAIRPVPVEKHEDGCVGFVWGRAADGRSVCVHVEGYRPRLFFARAPGDTAKALKDELEAEVRPQLRNTRGLVVAERRFCHFYGYEPDPTTASQRQVHDYFEVSYPCLPAWRAACRLRRDDDGGGVTATATATVRVAHEAMVDPLTRFLYEAGITPGGWVRVPTNQVATCVSTCDVELAAKLGDFTPLPERTLNAPYRACYYDIETLGLDPRAAQVIQVSLVFAGGGRVDKHVVALGVVGKVEGVTVHACNSEADVLRVTRAVLLRADPDFVVAYNGVNFDNQFLATRAEPGLAHRDGVEQFWYLSRFALRKCALRELQLNSSGMGDNLLTYFDQPGRVTLDFYQKFKNEDKSEPSYKLSHFAQKFCGDDKEDMDYREIPVLQAGSADDRARLASYCVHDSYLLHLLDQARNILVGILQFSQVFGIIPEWVYFRGQQVRFIAQLLAASRTTEALPLLLQSPAEGLSGQGETTFEGAVVNEPKKGFYKIPVVTLDWMSLYPSIMLAHNLCHSTLVRQPRLFAHDGVVAHDVRDGLTTHFATKHKGILPIILENLLGERKKAKKQIKDALKRAKETDDEEERARCKAMADVFDGRQLALKVSANSVYGACGATTAGKYYCKAVSETVTFEGRKAMDVKKEILPQRFPGIDVIYGDTDSVMVTFAGVTDVQEASDLGEAAATFVTEEFARRGYPSMVLENEKTFLPYLLFKKKRYIGKKYEPAGPGKMVYKGVDSKGVETERKDTLPFLKDIYVAARDALVHEMDATLALARIDEHMTRLIRGEVPFDKFVLSKSLKANYKNEDGIIQARVNKLRKEREAGSEEAVGSRVHYVMVAGAKDAKATDLAEDPTYAREKGLKLNHLFYFEHFVEKPLVSLFAVVDEVSLAPAFQRYRAQLNGARLNVSNVLRDMMTRPAAALPAPPAAAASSSSSEPASSASEPASSASSVGPKKAYIPRPPPPPRKKPKTAKR